jgi:hypothetical protein
MVALKRVVVQDVRMLLRKGRGAAIIYPLFRNRSAANPGAVRGVVGIRSGVVSGC